MVPEESDQTTVSNPAAQSGTESSRTLSIGQLVDALSPDFPELSISKVRYLEDRGLVSPHRSKGKYRKYTPEDARRLREILTMQRDEYLPLDIIRRRIDAQGTAVDVPRGETGRMGAIRVASARQQPVYTLEEFTDLLGGDEEFIHGLVEFRLVDQTSDSGPAFGEGDLETARICQRLRHFQIEPRHLRLLSSAAEREAGLVEQIATPDLRSGHADRKEYGVETVNELGTLLVHLTQLLLQRELRRIV